MRNGDGSAVVIGASMAGLSAARVLSERFGSVTVLDRDTLPDDGKPRRGVPQGAHGHILLVSGLRELAALFPGLEEELVAAGGTRFDTGLGLCTYRYGGRWFPAPTGLGLVSMSRPRLEAIVRDRVAKLPSVTIRDQVAVAALAGTQAGMTGVVLDTGETLPADLVVDCSGRGSRSDRWLSEFGFPAPEQLEIKIGVTYSTRLYRRRPDDLPDWTAIFTLPAPPHEKWFGIALPLEDDRWLVGLGGWHVDSPPDDAASFEAAALSLPDPILADLMARVEPLTDPLTYRFPSSRRRLFEKLDRLPAGYLALGDAICSFNPIYGQGMTCAAKEAVALGAALDRHDRADAGMAREYYRAAAELIGTPWQFAWAATSPTRRPRVRVRAASSWPTGTPAGSRSRRRSTRTSTPLSSACSS